MLPGQCGAGSLVPRLSDQAVQQSHAALVLAREIEHPYSLVCALSWAAILHWHRREPSHARS